MAGGRSLRETAPGFQGSSPAELPRTRELSRADPGDARGTSTGPPFLLSLQAHRRHGSKKHPEKGLTVKTILIWLIVIGAFLGGSFAFMTQMPGQTVPTAVGALSEEENFLCGRLKSHVESLALDIGCRGHGYPAATAATLQYLTREMGRANFDMREVTFDSKGMPTVNLEGTLVGTRRKDEVLLLGANYDTDGKSPGADDNSSGCAVLLEVARMIDETVPERSVRVVFFGNGAGHLAGDDRSGAWHYARE